LENASKKKLQKRTNRKSSSQKKRRLAARRFRLPWDNLKRYNAMSIDEKFEFALGGYRFPNNPGVPAIKLCRTVLNAPEDKKRGVMVGEALPHLPKIFIILYSKKSITTVPAGGIQRFYQIGISGKRYMQIHTRPCTRHGLANFVNAAVGRDVDLTIALSEETTQNMKRAQCSLQRSTSGRICQAYREAYPAYLRVDRPVDRGQELLMIYGSSFKLSPNNEIIVDDGENDEE